MNKKLLEIQQKIGKIQNGLLRIRDEKNARQTLHIKATADEDDLLNCVVTDDPANHEMLNTEVAIIQKSHDDYLYITGQVENQVTKKGKILSIRILKACWFVRKRKGSVSWLQEKFVYENYSQSLGLAS